MATHMAIGFVFLGGGKYTFDQDALSIAALMMAAFPRFPTSMTDSRCHLQAFRHLYVLAARHRCVEAVEVDTKQPVDVSVASETSRGVETATLPRLMLASGDLRSITLRSERYWPVTIRRAAPGDGPAAGRWMKALEATRRLYVRRRGGHLPHRLDHLGARGGAQAWFPSFMAPTAQHLERLLQIPKVTTKGGATLQPSRVGGVVLAWLQRTSAEGGGGPLELGTLTMSSAEFAAALCWEPDDPLPTGVHAFDFEDGVDGSLCERFASLLKAQQRHCCASARHQPSHVRYAHWLHECVIESKLNIYPLYLLLYFQTRHAVEDCATSAAFPSCPASLECSAMAADQLLMIEEFYSRVRNRIGAKHSPLLSEDFLAGRCSAVRDAFIVDGPLTAQLVTALREHHCRNDDVPTLPDNSLVGIYSRFNSLPGHGIKLEGLAGKSPLLVLPRLRRAVPGASAQGLKLLAEALGYGGA